MPKFSFRKLLHKIGSCPIFHNNSNCPQTPVEWQLLVALANQPTPASWEMVGVVPSKPNSSLQRVRIFIFNSSLTVIHYGLMIWTSRRVALTTIPIVVCKLSFNTSRNMYNGQMPPRDVASSRELDKGLSSSLVLGSSMEPWSTWQPLQIFTRKITGPGSPCMLWIHWWYAMTNKRSSTHIMVGVGLPMTSGSLSQLGYVVLLLLGKQMALTYKYRVSFMQTCRRCFPKANTYWPTPVTLRLSI